MKLRLVILASLLAATAASANAQWSGALGSSWNNPASASISRMLIDRMNQRMLEKRLAAKRNPSTEPAPVAEAPVTPARMNSAVRFRPSGIRIAVPGIVRELGGTPDEQNQMSAMLISLLDTFDKESVAKGYPNDLAVAFASFIVYSTSAYHDTPLPPEETLIELRDTFARIAVESGAFEKADNKTRQQMYETLVIFGTLSFVGVTSAKAGNDSASVLIYRQLAEQNIKTVLGLDPRQVTFGADGLSFGQAPKAESPPVPVAGPGAAEPIPAGELVRQFEENEIRANQLYGGKRIRVYGSVNSVDSESGGGASLTFRSSITSYGMARCLFEKAQVAPLAQVRSNAEVTVEGTVKGLGGGWDGTKAFVVLENCRIP